MEDKKSTSDKPQSAVSAEKAGTDPAEKDLSTSSSKELLQEDTSADWIEVPLEEFGADGAEQKEPAASGNSDGGQEDAKIVAEKETGNGGEGGKSAEVKAAEDGTTAKPKANAAEEKYDTDQPAGKNLRFFLVARHAERVDEAFKRCPKHLVEQDLNYPSEEIPTRTRAALKRDPPITRVGILMSHQTGRSLRSHNVKLKAIVCSPLLRCTMSASHIIKGYDDEAVKILVEGGLLENDGNVPPLMTIAELQREGFPVDATYTPKYAIDQLQFLAGETSAPQVYARHTSTVRYILEKLKTGFLILAHKSSLEFCTREIVGRKIRSDREIRPLIKKATELSMLMVKEQENGGYKIAAAPIPSFTLSGEKPFDASIFIKERYKVEDEDEDEEFEDIECCETS